MKSLPVSRRMVAVDQIDEETTLTTCFVGIEIPNQAPILFISTVIGGLRDGLTRRYATIADAKAGHADLVKQLQQLRNT